MGHSQKAQTYLSSPAAFAASAVKGHICGPDSPDPATFPVTPNASAFTPQDGLNADGIYRGKDTYQGDITLEKL